MIPRTNQPYAAVSTGPVVRKAPPVKEKKNLSEYEKLQQQIPHYMRAKVTALIEKTVQQRVSEHMDGFKKEVDREFEDQRKQNQHHVEFYLQAGVKPGAHIRLPTYKHPKVYKDYYREHGYGYGHPAYYGYAGYPPYAGAYPHGGFQWGHPNYGVPYVPRSKSPEISELDASRNYKYAPSKVYDLDLEAKQQESVDLSAEE